MKKLDKNAKGILLAGFVGGAMWLMTWQAWHTFKPHTPSRSAYVETETTRQVDAIIRRIEDSPLRQKMQKSLVVATDDQGQAYTFEPSDDWASPIHCAYTVYGEPLEEVLQLAKSRINLEVLDDGTVIDIDWDAPATNEHVGVHVSVRLNSKTLAVESWATYYESCWITYRDGMPSEIRVASHFVDHIPEVKNWTINEIRPEPFSFCFGGAAYAIGPPPWQVRDCDGGGGGCALQVIDGVWSGCTDGSDGNDCAYDLSNESCHCQARRLGSPGNWRYDCQCRQSSVDDPHFEEYGWNIDW